MFENIFVKIVEQAIKYNLVKGETFFTDSTHKKANANKNKYGFDIKEWALDSGYDTLDIKKYFEDNNIFGVIGYRRYPHGETEINKYKFKYNKELDCYVCPETNLDFVNNLKKHRKFLCFFLNRFWSTDTI